MKPRREVFLATRLISKATAEEMELIPAVIYKLRERSCHMFQPDEIHLHLRDHIAMRDHIRSSGGGGGGAVGPDPPPP